jgi:N-acetyl-anhydromuramyl-L-alanine amidase AmpD
MAAGPGPVNDGDHPSTARMLLSLPSDLGNNRPHERLAGSVASGFGLAGCGAMFCALLWLADDRQSTQAALHQSAVSVSADHQQSTLTSRVPRVLARHGGEGVVEASGEIAHGRLTAGDPELDAEHAVVQAMRPNIETVPVGIIDGTQIQQLVHRPDDDQGQLSETVTLTSERQTSITTVMQDVASNSQGSESVCWKALTGDSQPRAWRYIVLHHTATQRGTVAEIDASHRRRVDETGAHWLGIGYHFVIGNGHGMADGELEATFRWERQLAGAHAGQRDYNEAGIGICLVGHLDRSAPTSAQLAAASRLIQQLSHEYQIPAERIIGHRDIRTTACPGRHLPLATLKSAGWTDVGRPVAAGQQD